MARKLHCIFLVCKLLLPIDLTSKDYLHNFVLEIKYKQMENDRTKELIEQSLTPASSIDDLVKTSLIPAEELITESFRIEKSYSDQLNKLREITGNSKSDYIRTAVVIYLARPEVQLTLSTPQSNT